MISRNRARIGRPGPAMGRRHLVRAGLLGGAGAPAAGRASRTRTQPPEFRFRLQSYLGPGWMEWEELLPRYVERVRVLSRGRIEITPYPTGSLASTFEILDAVSRGKVDMGFGAQIYWRDVLPLTEFTWGVPFAFRTVEHYDYLWWEAGLVDVVREVFESVNVRFLGPIYSDEWGATMSREPIGSLRDFQGLRVRSFGVAGEIWRRNGADIVTLPGEELHSALATGGVDAVNWGSPYGMVASKLHEVAKFYTGPSLIAFDAEDMFINKDAFDSLPPHLQESLVVATRVFALERAATSTVASARAIQTMREAGVTLGALPEADVERIREMTDELLTELAPDDEPTQRALSIITELRDTLRQRPLRV